LAKEARPRFFGQAGVMKVHLLDGTYELFRHHFAPVPERMAADGRVVTGLVGVLESVLGLLGERSVTHLGVATDHVIESFRNDLWAGYKTGEGIDPVLIAQFHPLEEALRALGVTVWAMVGHEADDALATAAARAAADPSVEQVLIATPDKDLAQCVVGERVVQVDRRRRQTTDEQGVVEKFGVGPASIADYLALVGDSADGYPGLPGWGAKSAAAVLHRYGHLEDIPGLALRWDVPGLRGAAKLAATLAERRDEALLFRRIATVVRDCPGVLDGPEGVEELRWAGPTPAFEAAATSLGAPGLWERATALAARRRSG
jgi:5'-3' exonuclease